MDRRLETFLAVCQTMNYRRAAEALHLTQPAVTKQIQSLEASYGVRLFSYDGRKLRKTAPGSALEVFAISQRYQEQELERALHAAPRKILRVGATKTIGDYILPPAICSFVRAPEHELQFTVDNTTRLLGQLEAGQLDFVVVEGIFDKRRYDSFLLREEPYIGICAAGHRFAGRRVSPEELLRRPGTDFTPPPAAKKKHYANPVAEELGTAAMLRRPAFWLYYLWAVLLSAAGLALVSQSTSIAREIGKTVSPGGITTAVGMISLANAAGRVVLGGLFDRWGRSRTMQLVGGIFLLTGLVLIGALKLGSFPLLIAGFLLGGMAYGGVTPANAAFVSSYYGMRHYAVNLSVVVTNLLFASFGSTIAGALYDATGSYLSTDAMILVLAVLSAAVSFGIDLCDRRMLKRR